VGGTQEAEGVVRQLRGRKNKQINKANINKVNGILK
jgi:hypothetical protein